MSLNTESYIYKLRFSIDNDAPNDFMKRWLDFKNKCESGENRHIVEHVKELCLLQVNKDLPYLDRCEGGMGGNDNTLNKQIRFRNGPLIPSQYDNDIVLDEICSTEMEKWKYEEINDLLFAFIKVSEYYIEGRDCVRGCIEMTPQEIYMY
tara:strand:+ start:453 stop:902 length:450 start_codon:yes stop_codon:yes gene_type:complete